MAIKLHVTGLKSRLLSVGARLATCKSRFLLRKYVKKLRDEGKAIKVIVGAGGTHYEGWLTTDLPILDALRPAHWGYIFPPGSIDGILAEHVVEHWTEDEFRLFLKVIRPFLSVRARIRIAVPDGYHPDPGYIDQVKPQGTGAGADDHKVLHNYVTITQILSQELYEYDLLEHFDESGSFHRQPWDAGDGFVARSADFDVRNKELPLSYTSLIVDTWPKGGR